MKSLITKMFYKQRAEFERNYASRGREYPMPEDVELMENLFYDEKHEPAHRLDVYRPRGKEGRILPVIVNVHGGGLLIGNKEFNRPFCATLSEAGYVVFSIEYRLVPDCLFFDQVQDLHMAFSYIERHLKKYGGDSSRVYACGDSGGACLLKGAVPCKLQITAGNILYLWDKATITPDTEEGATIFKITIMTRPKINNRRKYPRMDIGNACTIRFKNSDRVYSATMDNISANGFAFLATDSIFAQSKGANIVVTIQDFELTNHDVLEGHIIRCSDDNGLYIVGCQMPEDNFYILEYVEKNLKK